MRRAPGAPLRTKLLALLAIPALLVLISVGCASFDSTAKKIEAIGADAQIQVATAYNAEKDKEVAALKLCGAAARAAAPPVALPALSDASPVSEGLRAQEACAALGVTIPYNPVLFVKLAGPINSFKYSLEALEAARLTAKAGGSGDFAGALAEAVNAAAKLYQALREAGVNIQVKALDNFIAQGKK